MYGYIYEITNLINGKKYIGQHKSNQFDEDYHGSGKILIQSINKNGWENNYSYKILEPINNVPTICFSKEELDRSEEFYIQYFNCVHSDKYYNLKPGGSGKSIKGTICIYRQTDGKYEIKQLIEKDALIYLDNGWIRGRPPQSKETIEKRISKLSKPRKQGTGEAISKSLKGKKLSEEHKKALQKPKKVANWRKNLITVIKDDIQLSIEKENLQYYLDQGFQRGAKKHSDQAKKLHSLKARNGIYMSNGELKIRPQLEDVDKYLKKGYYIIGKVSNNKYNQYISNK